MSCGASKRVKGKQKLLDSFEGFMGFLACDLTSMDSLNLTPKKHC
jgi:hypothetical protein